MIALSTMFEGQVFDKIKDHVKKHKTKYQIGSSLAIAGAGLLARRKGHNMIANSNDYQNGSDKQNQMRIDGSRLSNIGSIATLGGTGAALKSGLYKTLSNKIDDVTNDINRRSKKGVRIHSK